MELDNLFKSLSPDFSAPKKYKSQPLQKRKDVAYEVAWQTRKIESEGHKVICNVRTKLNETILIYRVFIGDGLDEIDITLKSIVITEKGITNSFRMFLIYDEQGKHLKIADIRVEGKHVNRGYGSALMTGLFDVIKQLKGGVKYISGWISSVDWDHIDRSVHFYTKHGFTCTIDHALQTGDILWVNPAEGGSIEEFEEKMRKNEITRL